MVGPMYIAYSRSFCRIRALVLWTQVRLKSAVDFIGDCKQIMAEHDMEEDFKQGSLPKIFFPDLYRKVVFGG